MLKEKVDLTKEFLENEMLITDITRDGRIFRGKQELKQTRVWVNKHTKYYWSFSSRGKVLCVHRAVYAWFWGVARANYVVDHIDNDPDNNSIDNLQEIDYIENNTKDRPISKYIPNMAKKKKYTEEYIVSMIKYHQSRVEALKQERNLTVDKDEKLEIAEKIHIVRASVAMWKKRLEIFQAEKRNYERWKQNFEEFRKLQKTSSEETLN